MPPPPPTLFRVKKIIAEEKKAGRASQKKKKKRPFSLAPSLDTGGPSSLKVWIRHGLRPQFTCKGVVIFKILFRMTFWVSRAMKTEYLPFRQNV